MMKEYEIIKKKSIEYDKILNVDKYYNLIENETFLTKTLTFSIKEAKVFLKVYKNNIKKNKEELSNEDLEILKEVEEHINDIIKDNFKNGCIYLLFLY